MKRIFLEDISTDEIERMQHQSDVKTYRRKQGNIGELFMW